jgi:hypothetical protein
MKYPITLLFILVSFISIAQTERVDPIRLNVEKQAALMGKLFLAKDFKGFTKYIYPVILEKAGGAAVMVKSMEAGLKDMEKDGLLLHNVTIGKCSNIIHFNNELQCTLSQELEMKTPEGRLIITTSLIGISTDDGKNWTFFDTHDQDLETLKNVLPNLSSDLVIPKSQAPQFYKE